MKKSYIAAAVIAIIIIAVAASLMMNVKAKPYTVDGNGIVKFAPRPAANFTISAYNDTEIATIYKVKFWSVDRNIYGLLSIPKSVQADCTTFILLPANSIPKESEQSWLGTDLNKRGYCAFSLDQRGIGETGEVFLNAEHELSLFKGGGMPEQYKMFYDALAAFDVLNSCTGSTFTRCDMMLINKSAIYMAGESMGGRVAIVAGAMEPKLAGVMAISTGGYGKMEEADYTSQLYVHSIDPDMYVSIINPRRLLMLHSSGDKIVNVAVGTRTFQYAIEPKKLIVDSGTDHGYYRQEKVASLNEGLPWLLGQ